MYNELEYCLKCAGKLVEVNKRWKDEGNNRSQQVKNEMLEIDERNRIHYPDVAAGRATFEAYMADCYERHKNQPCFRETSGRKLCKDCPKSRER